MPVAITILLVSHLYCLSRLRSAPNCESRLITGAAASRGTCRSFSYAAMHLLLSGTVLTSQGYQTFALVPTATPPSR
jgi:hypothetical protein